MKTAVQHRIRTAYVKREHLDPGYFMAGRGKGHLSPGEYIERAYSSQTS